MDQVIDFKGELIPLGEAVFINGFYYKKHIDAVFISNGWALKSDPDVVKDHSFANEYRRLSKSHSDSFVKGLIGLNELGYFTLMFRKSVLCRDSFGDDLHALSEKVAEENGYILSKSENIMYKWENLTPNGQKQFNIKRTPDVLVVSSAYGLADVDSVSLKVAYDKHKPLIGKETLKFSRLNLNHTFGLEFEFCNGFISPSKLLELGTCVVRDGSITGGSVSQEFVTLPLEGAKGIETLRELCTQMTNRCEHNNTCGVHLHLGSKRKDKLYIIALWHVACLIQDELFTAFPGSRQISIKEDGKQYCKKIPRFAKEYSSLLAPGNKKNMKSLVLTSYNDIYKFLNKYPTGFPYLIENYKEYESRATGTHMVIKNRTLAYSSKSKVHSHKGAKWSNKHRYYWFNLLPLLFADQETVEFRIHEATFNFEKVIPYILMCSAIMKYADKNTSECLKLSTLKLSDIFIDTYKRDIATYLTDYYDSRKQWFQDGSLNVPNNWLARELSWLKKDETFTFKSDIV